MKWIVPYIFVILFFQSSCVTEIPVMPETAPNIRKQNPLELLPQTENDLFNLKVTSLKKNMENSQNLVKNLRKKSSFQDSFAKFDEYRTEAVNVLHSFMLVELLSPNRRKQQLASQAIQTLRQSILEHFDTNKALYDKLNLIARTLSPKKPVESYFISETMKNFKRNGLALSSKQQEKFKNLNQEIQSLSAKFDRNVQHADRYVDFPISELVGLDDNFIKNLASYGKNKRVTTDYPTYRNVMKNAKKQETRKKTYSAFMSRAYPKNYTVLKELVQKRSELSKLLGFKSFAHYDIDQEMAKSPSAVSKVLFEVQNKSFKLAKKELQTITRALPAEVLSHPKGRIYPWDLSYVFEVYKKENYSLDSGKISEYFPMEKTMTGLLNLYSKVFSLEFKEEEKDHRLWHDSVRMIRVEKDKHLLGHVFLDLFPREHKYSHARVLSLRPSLGKPENPNYQAGGIVIIANNSKGTEGQPALFSHREVVTFFHEFGHALHSLLTNSDLSFLSSSEMAMTYGLPVKTDFVELPSTIFEKWLENPLVLQELSSHYKTNEKLPMETIQKLTSVNHLLEALSTMRLASLAKFSLDLYTERKPDIQKLYEKNLKPYYSLFSSSSFEPFPAAFLHLTSYGAKYYSYLWSNIFASDLFTAFENDPLNPEIGKQFRDKILVPGASQNPEELLFNFLNRSPMSTAFFHSLDKKNKNEEISFSHNE